MLIHCRGEVMSQNVEMGRHEKIEVITAAAPKAITPTSRTQEAFRYLGQMKKVRYCARTEAFMTGIPTLITSRDVQRICNDPILGKSLFAVLEEKSMADLSIIDVVLAYIAHLY
jgi:hypothetical protein